MYGFTRLRQQRCVRLGGAQPLAPAHRDLAVRQGAAQVQARGAAGDGGRHVAAPAVAAKVVAAGAGVHGGLGELFKADHALGKGGERGRDGDSTSQQGGGRHIPGRSFSPLDWLVGLICGARLTASDRRVKCSCPAPVRQLRCVLASRTFAASPGASGAGSSSRPTALRTASTSENHSSFTRFTSLAMEGGEGGGAKMLLRNCAGQPLVLAAQRITAVSY